MGLGRGGEASAPRAESSHHRVCMGWWELSARQVRRVLWKPWVVSNLDFYVDVVSSGAVLRVDATCDPDVVARRLSDDFDETRRPPRTLFRDHGPVEFHWVRDAGDQPWQGHHFTVQGSWSRAVRAFRP